MIAAADTTDLSVEQQAQLAYALTVIRSTGTLRGWSQYRLPDTGQPIVLRLLKRGRNGRLQQSWTICNGFKRG